MKKLFLIVWLLAIAIPAHAAVLKTISKTPNEAFDCAIDFAVASPNSITLQSVTAINFKDGKPAPAIIAASPAPRVVSSSRTVAFRVQGGVNNDHFMVNVKVADATTGEVWEGQMEFKVVSGTGH